MPSVKTKKLLLSSLVFLALFFVLPGFTAKAAEDDPCGDLGGRCLQQTWANWCPGSTQQDPYGDSDCPESDLRCCVDNNNLAPNVCGSKPDLTPCGENGDGYCYDETCHTGKGTEGDPCRDEGGTCQQWVGSLDTIIACPDNNDSEDSSGDGQRCDVTEGLICCVADDSGDTSGDTGGSFNSETSYDFTNPLGVESFTDWLQGILAGFREIVAILAILMIIVAGIVYMTAGGSDSQLTLGKNIATGAIIGFVIVIAAPSLLREIVNLAGSGSSGANVIDDAKSFQEILASVLNFLLTIIGILALISFVIGGYMYLTSGGDSRKIDSAKKIVMYSTLAILVSGSGVIIIRQIFQILEG